LSEKSVTVLRLIARGHSYSQIVDGNRGITYLDVFKAAEEALRLHGAPLTPSGRILILSLPAAPSAAHPS
jgi:hypothetical protein